MNEKFTLHFGKSQDVLKEYPDNHFDSVVCDPPYELGFMGKKWDNTGIANDPDFWAEVLRVLKPGGHLLAFSGSRTYHRMACGIEDAGFEIRDQIMWLYGSGFPKSHDVSKGIDRKRDDFEDVREVCAFLKRQHEINPRPRKEIDQAFGTKNIGGHWFTPDSKLAQCPTWEQWTWLKGWLGFTDEMDAEVWRLNGRKGQPGEAWNEREVTGQHEGHAFAEWETNCGNERADEAKSRRDKPATDAAKKWQGWGSALKPAHEPIVVARKPLAGTIAENVLTHGTGALNIDGCRVGGEERVFISKGIKPGSNNIVGSDWAGNNGEVTANGRWPANVIHDGSDEVTAGFPDSVSHGGDGYKNSMFCGGQKTGGHGLGDSGSAARFFYCAKASKEDRNSGDSNNNHATVKPCDLMRYLCRLVTPPGGLILDPFMGSGSTGKAAMLEGFRFVGIDMTPEYLDIARAYSARA